MNDDDEDVVVVVARPAAVTGAVVIEDDEDIEITSLDGIDFQASLLEMGFSRDEIARAISTFGASKPSKDEIVNALLNLPHGDIVHDSGHNIDALQEQEDRHGREEDDDDDFILQPITAKRKPKLDNNSENNDYIKRRKPFIDLSKEDDASNSSSNNNSKKMKMSCDKDGEDDEEDFIKFTTTTATAAAAAVMKKPAKPPRAASSSAYKEKQRAEKEEKKAMKDRIKSIRTKSTHKQMALADIAIAVHPSVYTHTGAPAVVAALQRDWSIAVNTDHCSTSSMSNNNGGTGIGFPAGSIAIKRLSECVKEMKACESEEFPFAKYFLVYMTARALIDIIITPPASCALFLSGQNAYFRRLQQQSDAMRRGCIVVVTNLPDAVTAATLGKQRAIKVSDIIRCLVALQTSYGLTAAYTTNNDQHTSDLVKALIASIAQRPYRIALSANTLAAAPSGANPKHKLKRANAPAAAQAQSQDGDFFLDGDDDDDDDDDNNENDDTNDGGDNDENRMSRSSGSGCMDPSSKAATGVGVADRTRLLADMLQATVRGVSEAKASAVAAHYGTAEALLRAYDGLGPDTAGKRCLLQNIEVRYQVGTAVKTTRFGQVLSARIYQLFASMDPHALL